MPSTAIERAHRHKRNHYVGYALGGTANPEYMNSFLDSGASIKAPSLLITLGNDQKNRSADQMKSVRRTNLKDTNALDGFGLCTIAGPTIIADEGGDPDLCGSSAETRMQSHKEIVETIESFLQVVVNQVD